MNLGRYMHIKDLILIFQSSFDDIERVPIINTHVNVSPDLEIYYTMQYEVKFSIYNIISIVFSVAISFIKLS